MALTTKIFKTCQVIFAVLLAYFALRLAVYHYALIVFPYADMLREGAIMMSTDALLKGLNPFAMELQPQYANVYGILYPLAVWPWAKIFGQGLLVHRAVTAFFIIASCVLVFLVQKRMKVPFLMNAWAVLMLYASLLYPGTSTPCVDSGAMGMFLFLLTIFVPWFREYSYPSLILSVLCGTLAFYTKGYTVLGIVVMASYVFFFVSKIKGLAYTLLWIALMSISIPLVNMALPAYFDNCFFVSANMTASWSSMERLTMQIHLYTGLHFWILLLAGALLVWYAFQKPKLSWKIPLVLYAGLWSMLILYTSLGRHNGATLWYFFQLLSPFLLISMAWLFSRHPFWPLVCVPFLVYNLYVLTLDEKYQWFNKNLPGWPQVAQVVSQHQRILNSSLIAPLLVTQNKEVFDNGMTEYFGSGGGRKGLMGRFFKEDYRVNVQLAMFFEKLRNMVDRKEFDLIILQPSLLPLGVGDAIRKSYKYEGAIELYAPQDRRAYAVSFWKPH